MEYIVYDVVTLEPCNKIIPNEECVAFSWHSKYTSYSTVAAAESAISALVENMPSDAKGTHRDPRVRYAIASEEEYGEIVKNGRKPHEVFYFKDTKMSYSQIRTMFEHLFGPASDSTWLNVTRKVDGQLLGAIEVYATAVPELMFLKLSW